MKKQDELQIRTLPRGPEKKSAKIPVVPGVAMKLSPLTASVGVVSALVIGALIYLPNPGRHGHHSATGSSRAAVAIGKKVGQASLQSISSKSNESVTRHLQDEHTKQQIGLLRAKVELEQFRKAAEAEEGRDYLTLSEISNRDLGVSIENEGTSERIYEELNDKYSENNDLTPEERINARLANRKWVNEVERRERIQFITNFVESAREQGYEVEINEDLVVVGVKKINDARKLSLNQIIDRMAKQGQ